MCFKLFFFLFWSFLRLMSRICFINSVWEPGISDKFGEQMNISKISTNFI
jgi:hypothetical protein